MSLFQKIKDKNTFQSDQLNKMYFSTTVHTKSVYLTLVKWEEWPAFGDFFSTVCALDIFFPLTLRYEQ